MSGPIAIIAALRDELKDFSESLAPQKVLFERPTTIIETSFEDQELLLVRTGIGYDNVFKSLSLLFEKYDPSLLISTGYAGATDPRLVPGDLVIGTEVLVLNPDALSVASSTKPLLKKAQAILEQKGWPHHFGPLLTVDRPVVEPHEKAFLGTRSGAIALDMESAEVGRWAVKKKKPFLAVRAILDPVSLPLPDWEQFLGPDQNLIPAKIFRFALKNPLQLIQLPRFQKLATMARTSIARFLIAYLQERPI